MANPVKQVVQDLVQPYLDEHGFELVDIEYTKEGKNRYLRVFVDKEGGIDLEDCSRISEYLSKKLDEADPIRDAYFLEVSSPGAERPLKEPKDFLKAVGKNVYITTYEPIEGAKEFEGELTSYDEEHLTVRDGNKEVQIPVPKVASARLAVIL